MKFEKIGLAIVIFVLFLLKLVFLFKGQVYDFDGIAWGITLIMACKFLAEGLSEGVAK